MKVIVYILSLLWVLSSCSPRYKAPQLPFVIDSADVLTANQLIDLRNCYVYLDISTHNKMGLLTIRNCKPEKDLSTFAKKYFERHNLGADTAHHNILIVFCAECHGVDIATGPCPDDRIDRAKIHAVIDTIMIPEFKYERHYAALQKGTDAIIAMLDTSHHHKH